MTRTAVLLAILLDSANGSVGFSADIDFAHDVVPILKKHCAECHSGEESEGGFSFNTERLLKESGYVEPGNPNSSRLVELITSADPEDQMPPRDRERLSDQDVATLTNWVKTGLPWEPGFEFGESAWEPPLLPRYVDVPPAAHFGENAIDRLLRNYGAEYDLVAMKPVDDGVFLRRSALDLIGLLPTIEEQSAFHDSRSASSRREFIDQLLARDHDYAEHWLSFWNDLLRNDYAGTGFIDGGRKQVSSWLYAALLQNKPFDDFVRELIAPEPESAGFINGIKWRGDVNASQVREIQFAQNVGQVFLGINMKCASCHDSFIDRWTLDEAYGLAAVYSTRELEIHRCDKPTGRVAKAAWIFPELGDIDPTAEQPERLKQLAALMTDPRNGRVNRTIVNRLWHRLMGHGIVHPVDAMHTQPWDEDLLDFLANELVAHDYDIKHILRLIATSQAYQAQPAPAADSASSDIYIFQGPIARHLTAEQFLDTVGQLTHTDPGRVDAPVTPTDYLGEVTVNPELGAWIWGHDQAATAPPGETVEFLRTFELASVPHQAVCVIACDSSFRLSVNGIPVRDANEPGIHTVDLRLHLHAGSNEILISGTNAGDEPNPAGLSIDVFLFDNGNIRRLESGADWDARILPPADSSEPPADRIPAIPVTPQNFLGDPFQDRLRNAIVGAILGNARPVRTVLVKSDMLARSLGRPNREQVVTVRPESLSTLQAIDLANGEILDRLLAQGGENLLPALTSAGPDAFIRDLFRKAFCREPTAEEQRLSGDLLTSTPDAAAIQDLLWTIIMLPEFQFVR